MCSSGQSACSAAHNGYCLNGGVCCRIKITTEPFCICSGEFTGKHCEKTTESFEQLFGGQGFSQMTAIIVAVVVVAACVIIAVVIFRRNDWQTRSHNTCRLLRMSLTSEDRSAPVLLKPDAVIPCQTIDVSHRLLSADPLVISSSPSLADDDVSVDCTADVGPP